MGIRGGILNISDGCFHGNPVQRSRFGVGNAITGDSAKSAVVHVAKSVRRSMWHDIIGLRNLARLVKLSWRAGCAKIVLLEVDGEEECYVVLRLAL